MNLQDYKNQYLLYTNQIKQIENERDSLTYYSREEFAKLFQEKQKKDREWFIHHFDYIWKYKDYFYRHAPFKDIILDFLEVYYESGYCGGAAYSSCEVYISLSNLIQAWNNGFMYQEYPIIEYSESNYKGKITQTITYIKDNQEFTVQKYQDLTIQKQNADKNLSKVRKLCIELNKWENYKTIDLLMRARRSKKWK